MHLIIWTSWWIFDIRCDYVLCLPCYGQPWLLGWNINVFDDKLTNVIKWIILMLKTNHQSVFQRHFFLLENESAPEIMYDDMKREAVIFVNLMPVVQKSNYVSAKINNRFPLKGNPNYIQTWFNILQWAFLVKKLYVLLVTDPHSCGHAATLDLVSRRVLVFQRPTNPGMLHISLYHWYLCPLSPSPHASRLPSPPVGVGITAIKWVQWAGNCTLFKTLAVT